METMTTAPEFVCNLWFPAYDPTSSCFLVDDSSLSVLHGPQGAEDMEERDQRVRQSLAAQASCGLVVQAESLHF